MGARRQVRGAVWERLINGAEYSHGSELCHRPATRRSMRTGAGRFRGQRLLQGRKRMPKISSLRGRMLLLILPAVVAAIAVLTILSISRASTHETDAVHDSLRNTARAEAANVNTEV